MSETSGLLIVKEHIIKYHKRSTGYMRHMDITPHIMQSTKDLPSVAN